MDTSLGAVQDCKINFQKLVGECIGNIRIRLSLGCLHISQPLQEYLADHNDQEVAAGIAGATQPAVKQLLSQRELVEDELLGLSGKIGRHKQGVYANILTHVPRDTGYTVPRIYIGGAAGPYGSQSQGMRANIRAHQNNRKTTKACYNIHEKLLAAKDWQANWAALVLFSSEVDRELVKLAHAVMVIMFGSCQDIDYFACRPPTLPPVPLTWGLNETGPLHFYNIATYNKLSGVFNLEEKERIRYRQSINGSASASAQKRQRCERLKRGGSIHVNVHKAGSRIKRFFITPMSAADGGPTDITIPLKFGLSHRLEQSRTVDMTLDLITANHHRPYASKSERDSRMRRLGIFITGIIPSGPRQGARFKKWLQSSRKEGESHAAKLIEFLDPLDESLSHQSTSGQDDSGPFGKRSLNFTPPAKAASALPSTSSKPQTILQGAVFTRNPGFASTIMQLIQKIRLKVLARKMKVTPTVMWYFKNRSYESIAKELLCGIRQPVVGLISSKEELTATRSVCVARKEPVNLQANPRLLSLGGDTRDPSQGVYANIVTSEDPEFYKIYVGSAAAISTKKRVKGIRRRIQEHLSCLRSTRKPQSGQPHSSEIRKEGRCCNFVVLVQFSDRVDAPLVFIAEAIMTILFASWNSQAFNCLRPDDLPRGVFSGLNNANPLHYGVCSNMSAEARQNRRESGLKRGRALIDASVLKAIEGGPVHITAHQTRPSYWNFRFKLCGETIGIPSSQGVSVGLHLRRVLHVQCEVSSIQHKFPYAQRAKWTEISSRLGICLKGFYVHGPDEGKEFVIWIQCDSEKAVMRASRLIALLTPKV